jgi:hypothetical protein
VSTYILHPHPDRVPVAPVPKVWVNVDLSAAFGANATLNLFYCVGAPTNRFTIPDPEEPARRDNLWQTTCFEAFLREEGGQAYREWNFAPSGAWAAYDFDAYREGMSPADVGAPPYIRTEDNLTWWTVGATIAVPTNRRFALGLSAVLEERDGSKSLWAVSHPPGKPDFHHDDCFAAKLP